MKEIIIYRDPYNIELLLIGVLIAALVISLVRRRQHPRLRHFPLYLAALLLLFPLSYIGLAQTLKQDNQVKSINYFFHYDYIVTLIEFLVFIRFFRSEIKHVIARKILQLLTVGFVAYFFFELVNDNFFYKSISEQTQARVYTVESLILVLPCAFYFIEMFKDPMKSKLSEEPGFWIASGLSFFVLCTLPFSLAENFLRKNHPQTMLQMYSIFYVFYILLTLLIIRAYLCRRKEAI